MQLKAVTARAMACLLLLWLALVVAAPASGGSSAAKGDAGESPAEAVIDAQSRQLLTTMGDSLMAVSQLSVEADVTYDAVIAGGAVVELSGVTAVHLQRPDRFRVQFSGDFGERDICYDGQTVSVYSARDKLYAIHQAPATMSDTVEHIHEQLQVQTPIVDLLIKAPLDGIRQRVDWVSYAGLHYLADGKQYHHLVMGNKGVNVQLWLADTERKLPVKMVIASRKAAGHPRYSATFSRWTLGEEIPAGMFRFVPPDGAKRTSSLRPDITGKFGDSR